MSVPGVEMSSGAPAAVDPTLRRSVLLEVADLRAAFHGDVPRNGEGGIARAVDGVGFRIYAGETLGLVGESGCGKTTTALAVLRLLGPGARIEGGEIRFKGRHLLKLPEADLRAVLGKEIGTVFQDPGAALNPVRTIGAQIVETIRAHEKVRRRAARARAMELLAKVGLEDSQRFSRAFPHQLSGGERQRAAIAIAIACGPSLLVLDEPTSALDTTTQAGVLVLLRALQAEIGMGILLITHDLAVVAGIAHRVAVMYAGKIVEEAATADLFERPRHPYTIALLRSRPPLDTRRGARLAPIPGRVPSPLDWPTGCRFHARCPIAKERCTAEEPRLIPSFSPRGERSVACHYDREAAEL